MVSDVLYDASEQIKSYLENPAMARGYTNEYLYLILACVERMMWTAKVLSLPPGAPVPMPPGMFPEGEFLSRIVSLRAKMPEEKGPDHDPA